MNIFMLAYCFPPDSGSGSFRPFFFANHLTNSGETVHVFTIKIEDYLVNTPLDADLITRLHPEVKVTRCSVLRPKEALLKFRSRFHSKPSVTSVCDEVLILRR